MKAKDLTVGQQAMFAGEWYEVTEAPKSMPITDDQPEATVFIAARALAGNPFGQEDAIVIEADRSVMTR